MRIKKQYGILIYDDFDPPPQRKKASIVAMIMDTIVPHGTTRGQGPEWEIKVRELASQVDRCVDCGAAMALLKSRGWQRVDVEAPYLESWHAPDGSPTFAYISFTIGRMDYGTVELWAAGKIQETKWKLWANTPSIKA